MDKKIEFWVGHMGLLVLCWKSADKAPIDYIADFYQRNLVLYKQFAIFMGLCA